MTATLSLPPAYELTPHEAVDSVVLEAKRLALKGADEGTLVWAREQTAAYGRFGRPWVSPRGNLYCALILRLDEPPAVAVQVNYVAAVSLAAAIAGLVSPMVELRYRWPNDILLYDAKVAGILLDARTSAADHYDWMVLGVSVNVESHPEDLNPPATSMHTDGFSEATATALLEAFSRYFLSWLNRWADEGFAPIRKAWIQRANGIGQPLILELETETLAGKFAEVDEEGALVMELPDGRSRRISVAQFFAI